MKRGITTDAEIKEVIKVHFRNRGNQQITRKWLQITKMCIEIKNSSIHKIEFIIRNSHKKIPGPDVHKARVPREMCRNVYSIIIYNSLKLETARMSINKRGDILWHSRTIQTIQQRKWTNYYYTKPGWSSETVI